MPQFEPSNCAQFIIEDDKLGQGRGRGFDQVF